jgi:hypothetical protein
MTFACSHYGYEGYEVLLATSKKVRREERSKKRKRSKCIWPGSFSSFKTLSDKQTVK